MVKVFISHQNADSILAQQISNRLRSIHGIESYLDIIDPDIRLSGDDLGSYVRLQLSKCTQLLAVVSANTKSSWWVPWEIGLATEKEQPIATFAGGFTQLPEYLKKWPYLQSDYDLDKYAQASRTFDQNLAVRKRYNGTADAQRSSASDFHKSLKASLGQ
ncbi:toll/interleukin-1 receptor domain-containing protein [Asticcacaulis taihuensis]|uniref:toll/interleukin-1 receptor domain-containing protein n=1 Tax=Asticcacaulis taihuensis TaxID=260084 RepID=UPI0034E9675D